MNRIITSEDFAAMSRADKEGIRAVCKQAGVKPIDVTCMELQGDDQTIITTTDYATGEKRTHVVPVQPLFATANVSRET